MSDPPSPVSNIPELHLCVIRRADIPNMIYHCTPPSTDPCYNGYWNGKERNDGKDDENLESVISKDFERLELKEQEISETRFYFAEIPLSALS